MLAHIPAPWIRHGLWKCWFILYIISFYENAGLYYIKPKFRYPKPNKTPTADSWWGWWTLWSTSPTCLAVPSGNTNIATYGFFCAFRSMVYPWKNMIFHSKLLSYQRLNRFQCHFFPRIHNSPPFSWCLTTIFPTKKIGKHITPALQKPSSSRTELVLAGRTWWWQEEAWSWTTSVLKHG